MQPFVNHPLKNTYFLIYFSTLTVAGIGSRHKNHNNKKEGMFGLTLITTA